MKTDKVIDDFKKPLVFIIAIALLAVSLFFLQPIWETQGDDGPLYFGCTNLNNTEDPQKYYYNKSGFKSDLMNNGWTEKEAEEIMNQYDSLSYSRLSRAEQHRIDLAINKANRYPNAVINKTQYNKSLNVSVKPDIGRRIDKLIVNRNSSLYYCEIGYTGGV